jgi:hypothetical protein
MVFCSITAKAAEIKMHEKARGNVLSLAAFIQYLMFTL